MSKIFKIFLVVALLGIISLGGYIYYLQTQNSSNNNSAQIVVPHKKPAEKITFIIGGDVMLGRAVAYQFHNEVTRAFENLGQNFFGNHDVGIVNLEGSISATEFSANPAPDNLIFNFPPQTIDALKYLGVNAVSQANNHSRNQGVSGLETTQNLLKENNIIPIGEQLSYGIERFGSGTKKLSVITIDLLEDKSDITETIKQEKAAGNIVLIFPHWGSEYEQTHNQLQTNFAHTWIDAGADIVIGSHPHVVQDAEMYNNKPIFYSLGNLIFDQTFSATTQEGLIIVGEIEENILKLELLPTKIRNLQVELASPEERVNVVNNLEQDLGFDTTNQENIIEIQITAGS